MKQKITDARVDYKGRLWLTIRTDKRKYLTVRCDDLQLDIRDSYEPIHSGDRGPVMRGFRKQECSIGFTLNKEPTISRHRPRAKP